MPGLTCSSVVDPLLLTWRAEIRGKMTDLEILWALDYSHTYTTARVHCFELFAFCRLLQPRRTLEIGAGFGISGVAIGLGSVGAVATVVDIEHIPRSVPQTLWQKFGIDKEYVKCSAAKFLDGSGDNFDFIFHDAEHGSKVIPEYHAAWRRTQKMLAIHDVDLIDYRAFVNSLEGVAEYGMTFDSIGRALGYIIKA